MGIFDFLKELPLLRTLSFQRYPDSFATTRETLYANLMEVLNRLIQPPIPADPNESTVFLTAHFPQEFFRLQRHLDETGIAYHIVTRPLDNQWYADRAIESEAVVYLALAEFLTETSFVGNEVFNTKLDLIVVDRHPEPFRDEALEQFARSFPTVTKMGYFLALEDRVLPRADFKRYHFKTYRQSAETPTQNPHWHGTSNRFGRTVVPTQ